MAKVIGIDLGTSNSAAAHMEAGRPVIIPSAEGAGVASGKAFPSFVAFTKDGQKLVGEPAKRQASINPEGTIFAAKRKTAKYCSLPCRKKEENKKYRELEIAPPLPVADLPKVNIPAPPSPPEDEDLK